MNPCEFDSKLWMQDNVVVFGLPMNLSQGLPLLLAVELLAVETAAGLSLLAPPNVWIARSFVTLPAQSARNVIFTAPSKMRAAEACLATTTSPGTAVYDRETKR